MIFSHSFYDGEFCIYVKIVIISVEMLFHIIYISTRLVWETGGWLQLCKEQLCKDYLSDLGL